ncbi:MerR family transcriptional regulator [Pandoraea anhela]|uniref:MerR family transcriptional regulator n=1 Tax=Pandoraea anhela TaxID=2508295 RepID=A0A5E4WF14_9BURK|nr:MerR family transcriptional regulator [Pandoraea anhela]VVE21625.1 MerR family transcriptional regulator [Pandoraea anhela]
MNIGQAAKASGVSTKMIRYYEACGLLRAPKRTQSNYRVYSDDDVAVLCFIRSARLLDFSTKQITSLISLWESQDRASSEVRGLVVAHIGELDKRIEDLAKARDMLAHLVGVGD